MDTLGLDKRTREDILQEIKEKAISYVPEWRFDETNPDIGTALALVYADMLWKTTKKLNKVPLKNRIAFFNALEADLLPAFPASGYVNFSVVNQEAEGSEVAAGTIVTAEAEDYETGTLSYETMDDVFVTPASLDYVFQTFSQDDYIGQLSDRERMEEEIVLFSNHKENLQEHVLYFCHDDALFIKERGWISLGLYLQDTQSVSTEFLQALADEENVWFEYYSKEGWSAFSWKRVKDDMLVFLKGESQPVFARTGLFGKESYWIRCVVHSTRQLKKFAFDNLRIQTKGIQIIPDSIFANGVESSKEEFFPFGERISNYSEVYFASEEVFCKKGARITLSFNVDYIKIPLDYNVENDPVEWEWIMKKSDFKPDLEYDITIEEVIWEYYNGTGWTRLFPDNRYHNLFSTREGTIGQYKKLQFICPDDMEPILLNALETYYIRARVMKVNNLFKMKGSYISPLLGNMTLDYDYDRKSVSTQKLIIKNNLETLTLTDNKGGDATRVIPFPELEEKRPAVYLGFGVAPIGGPIKLLFTLKDHIQRKQANLIWEYFKGEGWKELSLVDETENMSKTGIVTLIGNKDFKRKKLFEKELYWIRILDMNGIYGEKKQDMVLPCITGVFLNAVKIRYLEDALTEYFQMKLYQKNMKFRLLHKKIYEIQVFINEKENLSEGELTSLKRAGQLELEYDEAGVMKEVWVRWEQVPDFLGSSPEDRHFTLNLSEGAIQFGDGKAGRIPPTGKAANIKVTYKAGGGEYTNVGKGAVNKLNQTIGFISEVTNPEPLSGGTNVESLAEALKRHAARIRHQNKAITQRDFMELAREASRSIGKVKCFTGYDDKEQRIRGAVTLVILQKDFEKGILFNTIKNQVETYMRDKMAGNLIDMQKFFVTEPKFVALDIRVELVLKSFNEVFQVKKKVQERLTAFLNPLTGNFDGQGWEIGKIPNNLQIQNSISDLAGIQYVRNVYVSGFISEASGRREVDLETVKKSSYILPVSGTHEVVVTIQ